MKNLLIGSVCFECGSGMESDDTYVYMDVFHEEDNPEKMRIYAHIDCAKTSPNDSWREMVKS